MSVFCGYVISLHENHITIDIEVLFSLRFGIALEALLGESGSDVVGTTNSINRQQN